jgi:tRNA G37 N-methylase Trm5
MKSKLLRILDTEYETGLLVALSHQIVPFFTTHRLILKEYVDDFQRIQPQATLEFILKCFIIHMNLPFDMTTYMREQRDFIQNKLKMHHFSFWHTDDKRQKLINRWIREHAEEHRKHYIFRQVYCFEKYKEHYMPELEQLIHF